MTIDLALTSLSQGLLWAIMAIGIHTTYRILDFADLSAEGSFTLGGAVTARFITTGMDPVLSILLSILAGAIAGLITGALHTQLKIPPLLSGILTMTGLYSVNLRIMFGKANIPLMKATTIMTKFSKYGLGKREASIVVGIICIIIVILILWWFYNTEIGYAIRATGNNENMIKAQGVNTNVMKMLGLVIGNALVAFSGSLLTQYNGYADVGMGIGTIVIGLASVIIGEVVFSDKNSHKVFFSVVLGSILYRLIISFVLSCGLSPNDLRGISSILLAICLYLPTFREKISRTKMGRLLNRKEG